MRDSSSSTHIFAMADRKARLARLEELKRARNGEVSRSKEYKTGIKAAKIYDEVDDEEYRSVVRARLDEDDFIEDDDGSGYVDNGEEDDWNRRTRGSDDEEDDGDSDDGRSHFATRTETAKC